MELLNTLNLQQLQLSEDIVFNTGGVESDFSYLNRNTIADIDERNWFYNRYENINNTDDFIMQSS